MCAVLDAQRDERTMAETLSGDASLHLSEFDAPPGDPIALLRSWLDTARERGVREPAAVTLATADRNGRPSSRTVLVKHVDHGLVFAGHHDSRKGREMAETGWASATFYWRELLQQTNLTGTVERVSEVESDSLFVDRPVGARAASAASRQGRPLDDEAALRSTAAELAADAARLNRPVGWGGYRLIPECVEFWHGSPDRLHRRLHYGRDDGGEWVPTRLQP
ncbi:pyridoxamine 5'-phosphate oxidase [Parasphingorhabdus pacifica]